MSFAKLTLGQICASLVRNMTKSSNNITIQWETVALQFSRQKLNTMQSLLLTTMVMQLILLFHCVVMYVDKLILSVTNLMIQQFRGIE